MASLEALIRKRLMTDPRIEERLATYWEEPAIFLQEAPDDTAEGWGDAQFPRIVFLMDTFADAERGVMGGLSVDIICTEAGHAPEDIEPCVREALAGVFFTPDNGRTFSPKWRETGVFKTNVGEQEALILGMSVSFDVFEFPLMETSDPDPVAAIHEYALGWDEHLAVIGRTELPSIFEPSRERPAAYFRRAAFSVDLQTNTSVWMLCDLAVHLFAPELKDRLEWLELLAQSLALDGEITMLDGSPMFLRNVKFNANADEVTGQLTVSVRYGLLRKPRYAHTMMEAGWERG